jgi:hypothetical protein
MFFTAPARAGRPTPSAFLARRRSVLCRVGIPEAPDVAPVFNCEEVEKPAAALRGRAVLDIGAILPPGEDIAQVIALGRHMRGDVGA